MSDGIAINLDAHGGGRYDNNKHLFHQAQYHQLASLIQDQLNRADRARETKAQDINHSRTHNAILIEGQRGAGKTSMLINLDLYMQNEPSFKENVSDIYILDPIDPTLLNDHEDFLNIVVGQINRHPEISKERNASKEKKSAYYDALESLADALNAEQSTKDYQGIDRLLAYQGGLELAQKAHLYFKAALELVGHKIIVLPIDDVDMSLSHGFDVLEVVRKYLCSPYIVAVVSGDGELYQELVFNRFSHDLKADERKELAPKARRLAVEYLRKVFPIENRIRVPAISFYFADLPRARYSRGAAWIENASGKRIVPLRAVGNWLHVVMNGALNGQENSSVEFPLETARELMQLLKYLRPHLEELPPGPLGNRIAARQWWLTNISDTNIHGALADYFRMTGNKCLEAVNEDNEQMSSGLPWLEDLKTLNVIYQATQPAAENCSFSNETLSLFESTPVFEKQIDQLPDALRQSKIPGYFPLPSLEPIDPNLRFKSNYRPTLFNEMILRHLLSHRDFYTSYQTAPLVFFGRFFEVVVTSMFRELLPHHLKRIFSAPPYHSVIWANSTKTFDFQFDEEEESDEDEYIVDKKDLTELSRMLSEWRQQFRVDKLNNPSVLMLRAVASKYFNQLNLFKLAAYDETQRDRRLDFGNTDDLLSQVAQRAMYVLWSAFGSFEKGPAFGFDSEAVVHQNFAAANKLITPRYLASNNSYRINIHPFFEASRTEGDTIAKSSFTLALAYHPIFAMVHGIASAKEERPRMPVRRRPVTTRAKTK